MIIYLLLTLSLLSYRHTNAKSRHSAICFLTYRPQIQTIDFARELAEDAVKYKADVFIVIDDNNFDVSNITNSSSFQLLQIPNEQCVQYGYQKTISLADGWREVTSWDKALLYFGLVDKNYSFVWLIEDDVFISSVHAFRSLHELYSDVSDLIVPRNSINILGDTKTWLWGKAVGKHVVPWACSMVNVVGLSRRMLIAIDDYVQWLGEVPFHEFFFNTLAIHLNLTMISPTELSTIVYQASYSFEEVLMQPNNLWHPFKNLIMQKAWRNEFVLCSDRLVLLCKEDNVETEFIK